MGGVGSGKEMGGGSGRGVKKTKLSAALSHDNLLTGKAVTQSH